MKYFLIHDKDSGRDISEIVKRFDPIIIQPINMDKGFFYSLNTTYKHIFKLAEGEPFVTFEDDVVFEDYITKDVVEKLRKMHNDKDLIKCTTHVSGLGTQMLIFNRVPKLFLEEDLDCESYHVFSNSITLPYTCQKDWL